MAEKAYRKAQRPWYQKKRVILPLGLLLLIVVINMATGDESDEPSTTVSPGGATAAPGVVSTVSESATPPVDAEPDAPPAFPGATSDDTVAQAGDVVTTADGLVLSSTSLQAGNSTFGKTLCTSVRYENGSDESVSFNSFDWKLQDPNGTIVSPTFGGSDNSLNSGDLAPGGKVSGDVCFDDKVSASGQFVVLYEASFFSNTRIAWLNNR